MSLACHAVALAKAGHFFDHGRPRSVIGAVRELLSVGSIVALFFDDVVVVVVVAGAVVVVVVVHPTIATIHTPRTNGINFFIPRL